MEREPVEIEIVDIDSLTLDPVNARKHPDRNLEALEASLKRFGPQTPLAVVDISGVVRVGNARIEVARKLGWTHVPIVRTTLTGSEATAYAIADNRTSELAAWNDEVLLASLQGLAIDDDALLEAAGFTETELAVLAEGLGTEVEDEKQPAASGGDGDLTCPECGYEFD